MGDDLDEHLFAAAKLREVLHGDLDGDHRLHPHTGVISDPRDRSVLSFLESISTESFEDTALGKVVTTSFVTETMTEAVTEGNAAQLAMASGVTEQDLTGDQLTLASTLLNHLDNNDAPAMVLLAGNPNSGKTNTASLLVEIRKRIHDDYLVLSNARDWELCDVPVTSAHELTVKLLEHRHTPKAVFLDEGSTMFDARTYSRQVATQYTPLAKRYAKIGVDMELTVGHTGKDVHPERKRLTTLAVFKTEPTVAQLYSAWDSESDFPHDKILQGDITKLEATSADYDPDDAAPWTWDLEPELFTLDLDWDELLDELRDRGPAA